MKLYQLKPLVSMAKNPQEGDKSLTLIRGYDENKAAKYIITSSYRPRDEQILGFFYLLENAIKSLAVNAKFEHITYFMRVHPCPAESVNAALEFIKFIDQLAFKIDQYVRKRVYDQDDGSEKTEEIEEPETANQKSLLLTRELETLVENYMVNLKGHFGMI